MSVGVLDGVTPRSRSTDPTTSVDAGRAVSLTDSQQDVLVVFELEQRPLADHELVAEAARLGSPYSDSRVRSARAELAEAGLLELVEGETRTTKRGKSARVWRLA